MFSIITVMVIVLVQSCNVNDGFGFKELPRQFFSDPRPHRGRHALAPRDPIDPVTLPTLLHAGFKLLPAVRPGPGPQAPPRLAMYRSAGSRRGGCTAPHATRRVFWVRSCAPTTSCSIRQLAPGLGPPCPASSGQRGRVSPAPLSGDSKGAGPAGLEGRVGQGGGAAEDLAVWHALATPAAARD